MAAFDGEPRGTMAERRKRPYAVPVPRVNEAGESRQLMGGGPEFPAWRGKLNNNGGLRWRIDPLGDDRVWPTVRSWVAAP